MQKNQIPVSKYPQESGLFGWNFARIESQVDQRVRGGPEIVMVIVMAHFGRRH